MRGPDGDGPAWAGRRRGRGPGRGPEGRDGEGREAVVSLITALRQIGRVGDRAQRQSARIVIDDAVRAIWSILAQGPAPADAPDADGLPVTADAADEMEAGDPTDAATDA